MKITREKKCVEKENKMKINHGDPFSFSEVSASSKQIDTQTDTSRTAEDWKNSLECPFSFYSSFVQQ